MNEWMNTDSWQNVIVNSHMCDFPQINKEANRSVLCNTIRRWQTLEKLCSAVPSTSKDRRIESNNKESTVHKGEIWNSVDLHQRFYSDLEIFLPNRSSSPGADKNNDQNVHIPSYVVVIRNIRERPNTA